MPTEIVKLSEVMAGQDDLRRPDPELQVRLTKSVQDFGLLRLPVRNVRTNNIVDGRLLVNVLRGLGWTVCEMFSIDIPVEHEKLMRCLLNNHASDWNWQPVSLLLKSANAEQSGFHSMDINPLLAADWKPAEPIDGAQFTLEL